MIPISRFLSKYYDWLLILLLMGGCVELPKINNIQVAQEKVNLAGELPASTIQAHDMRLPEYEKLTYDVRWLGLRVGTLTTSIIGTKSFKGRNVYILEATIKTNAFLSKIYKIEDRFLSYVDVEKLYTLRHEVYRRDGSYKKDAITDFDQSGHKAYFKNFLDKSEKNFDIPAGVQDILSACYYFMLLPLKVGNKVEYYVCNNEKNYQFFGLVQSKALIRLPVFGRKAVEAFLIEPYAKLKGKKVDKGNVRAYFSCEKRRIPLVATVKGPIFTEVSISLSKIERK